MKLIHNQWYILQQSAVDQAIKLAENLVSQTLKIYKVKKWFLNNLQQEPKKKVILNVSLQEEEKTNLTYLIGIYKEKKIIFCILLQEPIKTKYPPTEFFFLWSIASKSFKRNTTLIYWASHMPTKSNIKQKSFAISNSQAKLSA